MDDKIQKERISIDLLADALCPSDSHRADTKISEFCRLSRSRLRACLRPCLVGSARDAVGAGVAAGRARPLAVATRGADAPHVLAVVTVILTPRPTPHPAQSIPARRGRNRSSIRSIVYGRLANRGIRSLIRFGFLLQQQRLSSPKESSVSKPHILTTDTSNLLMYLSTDTECCRVGRIAPLHRTEPGADEAGLSGPNRAVRCAERALLRRRKRVNRVPPPREDAVPEAPMVR